MKPIDALMNKVAWTELQVHGTMREGIPYATHEGVLEIEGLRLKCYQLNTGQRIFDMRDLQEFFGMLPGPTEA